MASQCRFWRHDVKPDIQLIDLYSSCALVTMYISGLSIMLTATDQKRKTIGLNEKLMTNSGIGNF